MPILGYSPGGKVVDFGRQFGAVEIKCLETKFTVIPLEVCQDSHFCFEMGNGRY